MNIRINEKRFCYYLALIGSVRHHVPASSSFALDGDVYQERIAKCPVLKCLANPRSPRSWRGKATATSACNVLQAASKWATRPEPEPASNRKRLVLAARPEPASKRKRLVFATPPEPRCTPAPRRRTASRCAFRSIREATSPRNSRLPLTKSCHYGARRSRHTWEP